MIALRVCEGAVSSEQRRTNGASAAACVRMAGAATVAIAEATNLRRDNDEPIFILLLLCWFTGCRALGLQPLTVVMRVGANRTSMVQRMRPMPDMMSNALTTSSNCRSDSRLKMRNPNHAPSKAAGTKASVFQSNCVAVEDDGRIK